MMGLGKVSLQESFPQRLKPFATALLAAGFCGKGAMSWQAVTWVLEQSESELGSRLVLISIASHADREGHNACPSISTITRECLMSEREVHYCIQTLEEHGELHVERGGGRGNPNRYVLPFVKMWLESANNKYTKRVQSLQGLRPLKGATAELKGAICDTKGCNAPELSQKESSTSSLQPLEPYKNRTVKKELRKVLSSLEPSKPLSKEQLRAEADRQIQAMRERGYLA